jgi:hypothetical protein
MAAVRVEVGLGEGAAGDGRGEPDGEEREEAVTRAHDQ